MKVKISSFFLSSVSSVLNTKNVSVVMFRVLNTNLGFKACKAAQRREKTKIAKNYDDDDARIKAALVNAIV